MRVVCAQPRDALVVTAYFGEALDVIKKGGSSTRKTKYLIQFPAAFRSGLHLRRSGPALLPAGNYAGRAPRAFSGANASPCTYSANTPRAASQHPTPVATPQTEDARRDGWRH